MGRIRFLARSADALASHPEIQRGYFRTFDGRILTSDLQVVENEIICDRPTNESGAFEVFWPFGGDSRCVLSTTTLRESSTPYHIELELARGRLAQLREQHESWATAGMRIPEAFIGPFREAHALLCEAALSDRSSDASSRAAVDCLERTARAADVLVASYSQQRLGVRHQRAMNMPVSLGCRVRRVPDNPDLFLQAFNAAIVAFPWHEIEPEEGQYNWEATDATIDWCRANGLAVLGGPLLNISSGITPDWLSQWTGNEANLQGVVADYVETVVNKYVGRIRHWEVIAGGNRKGALELTEEQRLNLLARSVEAAVQVDEQVQISLRIAQPWGEYMRHGADRLAPRQFIDTLMRCGVRVSEINLELKMGFGKSYSLDRDLLAISRLLDMWSVLQLPLNVLISVPSGPSDALPVSRTHEVSEHSQARWIESVVPLLMAKDRVVGVHYLQLQDREGDDGQGRGLIRKDGTPRPSFEHFQRYRKAYWRT